MKKLFYFLIPLCLLLPACNWFEETSEVGEMLSIHFENKLYKKFDTAAYHVVFKKHMDSLRSTLTNPKDITGWYTDHQNEPVLVTAFFADGSLDSLAAFIRRSPEHGFSPAAFGYQHLDALLTKLEANKFKNIQEVYPVVAALELQSAESLLIYHNTINFGALNPKNLLNRYYIPTERPNAENNVRVLGTASIQQLLASIQPTSANYKALQKAMLELSQSNPQSEDLKTLLVNMERERWKLPARGTEYVEVNVPDFTLTWFNKKDTLIHMKVCVGGSREAGYDEKIQTYLKSHNLDDLPKNHQTPLLFSKLNAIQVNPVWNIPSSIAQSEIYYQALKDPYYLSNSNMSVYYKGKRISDPDTIQWRKYSREKLPFTFKQGSGGGNALGKFKFLFDNKSSIYLHDTNNKNGFNLSNRAISHGCVRVEKPLEFAQLLVESPQQFDKLRMEVNLPPLDTTKMNVFRTQQAKKTDSVTAFELKPKWFGTKKQVPLLINYVTAWADQGSIQYRRDVYGMDKNLWTALSKMR
ncbi:MAG: L,D-transpeptidase [Chryseobacterium sp.]|nr:MAG: L,D-transpeptidase [Chryseobacterium sp.]